VSIAAPLRAVADALWNARATRQPIPPPRQWLERADCGGAYEIQRYNHARAIAGGRRCVGRKIGLTSAAVQRQLGVGQPDYGLLFDDMVFEGEIVHIPSGRFIQPRIEGEIAFIVGEDIERIDLPSEAFRRAAGNVTAAFEIVDSAIADWNITVADTIADNASCGAVVMSEERWPLVDRDWRLAGMVMSEDDRVVSLGVGAATLGDPLTAFRWLANLAIEQGMPLRRGEIVLTGALGPMVPFVAGRQYRLEIAGCAPLMAVADA